MSARTLITGGAGFVGRHVIHALVARGERVRCLDLAPARDLPPGVESVEGSILDAEALARAVEGVDAVIHAAANAHLWAKDRASFDAINHGGTRRVAETAKAAGARRLVYVSSLTTLVGRHMGRAPVSVTETERLSAEDMLGPYPLSKWRGEKAAFALADETFTVVSALPTLPVGAGDHGLTAPTRMIFDLVNGRIPAFLDCVHNFIDVRDLAEGLILARDRGSNGERYLLGHENMTMADFVALLGDMTGIAMPRARAPYPLALMAGYVSEWMATMFTARPPQAPLTGVKLAGRRVYFDASKARDALGLVPRPIAEALRASLAWGAANGHITRTMPAFETEPPAP